MTSTSRHPPIRRLDEIVDGLAEQVSPSRHRQLRMTVRQLERALAAGVMPHGSESKLPVLLGPEGVDAFLEAAAEGRLRDDPARGELSWSSVATLRDCLKILGEESAVETVLPKVWRRMPADLAPLVPAGQRAALYRRLADMAAAGPLEREGRSIQMEARTRLLAMVAVVLDTGARASEVSGMRLDDLAVGLSEIVVRRRPQNGAHLPAVVETFPLRERTRAALRRWLVVRDGLVAVGGRRRELWVSLKGTRSVGAPLQPRGVERAYAKGVAALNVVMGGEWGWEPLPARLEVLRRSVGADG